MTAAMRNLFWILAASAILLLPAILWGRPFVFYDTPAYWGWGRDLYEALQRPWPQAGQPWIAGRPLYGWEIGAHGATSGDLRFTVTLLTARSAFYAVPLYLLTAAGGLWLVAALQALVTAWALHLAFRVLAPGTGRLAYLGLVAGLMALSSLGFETAYAMPDLFGGLALLAAGLLIARPESIGRWSRLGLVVLMVYAALVHTANLLDLAVAVVFSLLVYGRAGLPKALSRVAPVAAALAVALVASAVSQMALAQAFGRPLLTAPFLASRVLADGTGQSYLRRACGVTRLAACDLAEVKADYPEYYLGLYPLEPPPPLTDAARIYDQLQFRVVSDAEAEHRERFVREQPRLVLGALLTDGGREAGAMLASGAAETLNFGVNRDFDSLRGLMREHTRRRDQIVALTPGAAACVQGAGRACGDLDIPAMGAVQGLTVWLSLALLAVGALRKPAKAAATEAIRPFVVCMVGFVLANALICGGLSGAYDRYQSRVEWLIPFCALIGLVQWARRGRTAGQASAATIPSPVASIVAAAPAARRS
jgi:hypothetical protein